MARLPTALIAILLLAVACEGRVARDPMQEEWDYIVVGSGPGGSTVARVLALGDPSLEVLVLEAGEDHDGDEPIMDSRYAPSMAESFFPQYWWQAAQLPSNRSKDEEQFTGGRLLGGSSSIGNMQWVRPSLQWLQQLFLASGQDPDYRPSQLYSLLQKLERFNGPNILERGRNGPVPVRWSPSDGTTPATAMMFAEAVHEALGFDPITDYNDPDTPIGPFTHWQLSQYPLGRRASASVAMLTDTLRQLPNLSIKTRTTALRVVMELDEALAKPRATGVYVLERGWARVLKARKGVILAAGQRSSLLLELSGIGNKDVIKPLLETIGMPMWVDLPGVGESLGNNAILFAQFEQPAGDAGTSGSQDAWSGGAFLPYPGAIKPPVSGTWRFSEWFTIDPPETQDGKKRTRKLTKAKRHRQLQEGGEEGTGLYSVGMMLLNVTSRGFVHIQSADPLTAPLASTRVLTESKDMENWVRLLKEQLKPISDKMAEKGYRLLSPAPELFTEQKRTSRSRRVLESVGGNTAAASTGQSGPSLGYESLEDFVTDNYVTAYNWHGTCRMAPVDKMGVVDSNGFVHGVANLQVADASIIPIRPDGLIQSVTYLLGALIAKKILKSQAAGKEGEQKAD